MDRREGGRGGVVGAGEETWDTGTAKGKCLNHLKLQRQRSVTVANSSGVCLLEYIAHLWPSLLPLIPPSLYLSIDSM